MERITAAEDCLDEQQKQRLLLLAQRNVHQSHFPEDDRPPVVRQQEHLDILCSLNRRVQCAEDSEHARRMELDRTRRVWRADKEREIVRERQMHHGLDTPRSRELLSELWREEKQHEFRERRREMTEMSYSRMSERAQGCFCNEQEQTQAAGQENKQVSAWERAEAELDSACSRRLELEKQLNQCYERIPGDNWFARLANRDYERVERELESARQFQQEARVKLDSAFREAQHSLERAICTELRRNGGAENEQTEILREKLSQLEAQHQRREFDRSTEKEIARQEHLRDTAGRYSHDRGR